MSIDWTGLLPFLILGAAVFLITHLDLHDQLGVAVLILASGILVALAFAAGMIVS